MPASKVEPAPAPSSPPATPSPPKKKRRPTNTPPSGLSSSDKKLLKPYTYSGPLERLLSKFNKGSEPKKITGLEAAVVRKMRMSGSQVRRCHRAFRAIDFDGSGTITIKEFIYFVGAEPTKFMEKLVQEMVGRCTK